jgi:hypothetical protein
MDVNEHDILSNITPKSSMTMYVQFGDNINEVYKYYI